MAAAGAVLKLRFTPLLSSKAKACAIPWTALLLPQLGTCLLGAIESKAGGQVPFWEAAPCHRLRMGQHLPCITCSMFTATIKTHWKKTKHIFPFWGNRCSGVMEIFHISSQLYICSQTGESATLGRTWEPAQPSSSLHI